MLPTRASQVFRAVAPFRPAYRHAVLVPEFESIEAANDMLQRLQWYFGNTEAAVTIRVGGFIREVVVAREGVRPAGTPRRLRSLKRALILVHAASGTGRIVARGHRARVMDETACGKTAIMTAARLSYADLLPSKSRRALVRLAASRTMSLRSWLQKFRGCQLFGTGPSIERVHSGWVAEHRSDRPVLRIACNSIVSDASLMETIRPHILTYGDPAFHFGDSEYAQTFRADVRVWMARCPELRLVVPLEFFPLIEDELAEFGARVVPCRLGLPRSFDPLAFQRRGNLLRTGNIATSAMIPLGVVAGSTMEVFGFDGRASSDERFWAHSPRAQYGHLYASVMESHPSFFRDTSFVGYYEEHCRRLAASFERVEVHGIRVLCRTNSHIPCLAARYLPISAEGDLCG